MTAETLRGDALPPSIRVHRQQFGGCCSCHIEGTGAVRTYVAVRPDPGPAATAQATQAYGQLAACLQSLGARTAQVVTERLYCRDLHADGESLRRSRAEFYGPDAGPATTYLEQPPCTPGVAVELQAMVLSPVSGTRDIDLTRLRADLGAGTGVRLMDHGDCHLHVHNITGGAAGDGGSFGEQMESIFARTEALLELQDLNFHDVVRTWIYLPQMERDYDELNRVRTTFFERHGIERLPASTGIQGGVYPADRAASLDFYALRGRQPVGLELMHANTLNEAWSYGSSFSRGMAVTQPDRRELYVSGTASIDEAGQVVCVGDIEGQTQRLLTNIEALLEGSGATPADLVQATTYLKDAGFLDTFVAGWIGRGFPADVPHNIVTADVCRPDWLCETEVVAVVPPAREAS